MATRVARLTRPEASPSDTTAPSCSLAAQNGAHGSQYRRARGRDHATATSRSPHAPTAPRRRRTRPSHSRSPSLARAPCSAPRRRPRSSSATTTKREPAGPRISSSDRTAEGAPEQQQRCVYNNGWSRKARLGVPIPSRIGDATSRRPFGVGIPGGCPSGARFIQRRRRSR